MRYMTTIMESTNPDVHLGSCSGRRLFYLAEIRLFQLAVNTDRFIQRQKAT